MARRAAAFALALAAVLPRPAAAADGIVEINHACATAGGCFAGDAAGYPVTITAPGSYRLTGNLTVPAGANGIEVTNGVDLDLAGFEIAGPVSCLLGCPAASPGSGVVSGAFGGNQCAVSNGKIRGFGEDGVRLGLQADVRRLRVTDVARDGISLSGGSVAADNLINRIGRNGIRFTVSSVLAQSMYRDNTIANAVGQSVLEGKPTGPNVCQDQRCGRTGKQRYYLTPTEHLGAAADAACAVGFHMASLWEIIDTASLEYDTSRGFTSGDSAKGPTTSWLGWIRTGAGPSSSGLPGAATCSAWTSSAASAVGTLARPRSVWTSAFGALAAPWDPFNGDCNFPAPVWCVED
jgi:hypothetical protein